MKIPTTYHLTLENLQRKYPDKILLSVDELADILGIAKRSIYNRSGPKAQNQFPIKPVRYSKFLKFSIFDIAVFLSNSQI